LVTACYRSTTGVLMELGERRWKQVGLMCDTCGHMEFYTQDPQKILRERSGYFERTEPEDQPGPA
jgi:hypothetical protein